jgi:hypothetical protein
MTPLSLLATHAQALAQVMPPTENNLVIAACVGAVAMATVWFVRVILGTRDTVREIRGLLLNRRNGLVKQVDEHEARIDGIEHHLGIRPA